MSQKKMVAKESTEMVVPEIKKVEKKKMKALVNMHLPTGKDLIQGEMIELSDEDIAHLKQSFGEKISRLVE